MSGKRERTTYRRVRNIGNQAIALQKKWEASEELQEKYPECGDYIKEKLK